MKAKSLSLVLILALGVLALGGCKEDPSKEELEKGKRIDIQRMRGSVLDLGVGYYVGDRDETKEMQGEPYYWAKIQFSDHSGTSVSTDTDTFSGIPVGIYDGLSVGMTLPGSGFVTLPKLIRMEGLLIGMSMHREAGMKFFYLVVKTFPKTYIEYETDETTYYELKGFMQKNQLDFPLTLPLEVSLESDLSIW